MDQLEAKADHEGGRDSIILYVNGKRYQIYLHSVGNKSPLPSITFSNSCMTTFAF